MVLRFAGCFVSRTGVTGWCHHTYQKNDTNMHLKIELFFSEEDLAALWHYIAKTKLKNIL